MPEPGYISNYTHVLTETPQPISSREEGASPGVRGDAPHAHPSLESGPSSAQTFARLRNMADQALKEHPAATLLTRKALSEIIPEPPKCWFGAGRALPEQWEALAATAERAGKSLAALDALPASRFIPPKDPGESASPEERRAFQSAQTSYAEAFQVLREAVTDQQALGKALARYEESANLAPDPTRLAIQRGCDFRAGELIAMAAELFTTDRPQPEGVSVADARRALSLEMHGGKTVLAALQGRANQLFTEIDNLRSQESSGHDLNKEVKRLKKDLQELKEEIAVELTPSSDPASVRLELDRPSFEPLRLSLEAAEQRVDALMESPAKFFTNERLVDELVDTRPLESFINQTGSERSENDQKQLDAILRGFKYLKTLIRGQLDTPPGRINLESRDVLSARRALNNQIVAMSHNSNLSGNDFHRFVGIVSPLGVIGDSIEVFDAEAGRLNALKGRLKHPPYQTSQYLALAASEHVSVESLMECHMRGVDPGLIELRSDHNALISQETLGAGAINTVTLCQYKTAEGEPVDLVFKPEREARYGLAGIPISSLGYSPDARALDLNAAAYKAADAVGAGHTLCRTSAGTFEGHFGMFMELAPGQTGRAVFFNPEAENNPDSVLNRMVSSPQYPTIKTNLMREMCKLEWADTLSGQVDRHPDNYLVDINTETGDVRVTGIDNDACFSHNMVGPGLVRYNGEIKDTSLLSKEEFNTVVRQQGLNQVNRPQFIDKDTYDNLMSIDVDAYRESIKNHLNGDEQALESAVARLQNAQKYAKTLADQGRVVEDWESHQIDGQSLMQLYEAHNTAEVDRLGDNAGRSVGFFGQCLSSLQSAEQRLSARP